MSLAEALALFRRLGVNVETMSQGDFSISYFALAKRYHPDRNPRGAELMANINAARAAILNSPEDQPLQRKPKAGVRPDPPHGTDIRTDGPVARRERRLSCPKLVAAIVDVKPPAPTPIAAQLSS
jgi:curved DNA-binding protein CbpA